LRRAEPRRPHGAHRRDRLGEGRRELGVTSLLPPTWHPAVVAALVVASGAYLVASRRGEFAASRAERRRFAAADVLAYLVCSWPLGDLAAHVSITAVVVQRLVLMLAVASVVLSSLPV